MFMFLLLGENGPIQCALSKFSIVDLEEYYIVLYSSFHNSIIVFAFYFAFKKIE